jgi:hypothetical protein
VKFVIFAALIFNVIYSPITIVAFDARGTEFMLYQNELSNVYNFAHRRSCKLFFINDVGSFLQLQGNQESPDEYYFINILRSKNNVDRITIALKKCELSNDTITRQELEKKDLTFYFQVVEDEKKYKIVEASSFAGCIVQEISRKNISFTENERLTSFLQEENRKIAKEAKQRQFEEAKQRQFEDAKKALEAEENQRKLKEEEARQQAAKLQSQREKLEKADEQQRKRIEQERQNAAKKRSEDLIAEQQAKRQKDDNGIKWRCRRNNFIKLFTMVIFGLCVSALFWFCKGKRSLI